MLIIWFSLLFPTDTLPADMAAVQPSTTLTRSTILILLMSTPQPFVNFQLFILNKLLCLIVWKCCVSQSQVMTPSYGCAEIVELGHSSRMVFTLTDTVLYRDELNTIKDVYFPLHQSFASFCCSWRKVFFKKIKPKQKNAALKYGFGYQLWKWSKLRNIWVSSKKKKSHLGNISNSVKMWRRVGGMMHNNK